MPHTNNPDRFKSRDDGSGARGMQRGRGRGGGRGQGRAVARAPRSEPRYITQMKSRDRLEQKSMKMEERSAKKRPTTKIEESSSKPKKKRTPSAELRDLRRILKRYDVEESRKAEILKRISEIEAEQEKAKQIERDRATYMKYRLVRHVERVKLARRLHSLKKRMVKLVREYAEAKRLTKISVETMRRKSPDFCKAETEYLEVKRNAYYFFPRSEKYISLYGVPAEGETVEDVQARRQKYYDVTDNRGAAHDERLMGLWRALNAGEERTPFVWELAEIEELEKEREKGKEMDGIMDTTSMTSKHDVNESDLEEEEDEEEEDESDS